MPKESTHTWATLALAAALVPVDPALAAGALVGLVMDPDLDQAHAGSRSRLGMYSRPLSRFWSAAWEPYDQLAKHRGASHWPVVGTAGRVGYMALAPAVATEAESSWPCWFAAWGLAAAFWLAVVLCWRWVPRALLGLALSDLLHVIMDWGWSLWRSFWS